MALVHATCDLICTEHSGDCFRGSKNHTACNALNCQAYAIAMKQREKILETFGLPTNPNV